MTRGVHQSNITIAGYLMVRTQTPGKRKNVAIASSSHGLFFGVSIGVAAPARGAVFGAARFELCQCCHIPVENSDCSLDLIFVNLQLDRHGQGIKKICVLVDERAKNFVVFEKRFCHGRFSMVPKGTHRHHRDRLSGRLP